MPAPQVTPIIGMPSSGAEAFRALMKVMRLCVINLNVKRSAGERLGPE
jgi:hypothetical protein